MPPALPQLPQDGVVELAPKDGEPGCRSGKYRDKQCKEGHEANPQLCRLFVALACPRGQILQVPRDRDQCEENKDGGYRHVRTPLSCCEIKIIQHDFLFVNI